MTSNDANDTTGSAGGSSPAAFTTVIDGLRFAEGPRWHEGALWFSDMYHHRVHRLAEGGELELVAELHGDKPSGLGWLPDGRLLVVAMGAQQLLRQEPDGSLVTHAELASVATGDTNDMIVSAEGVAYVGDMGYRIDEGIPADLRPAAVFRVDPDGTVSVGSDDMGVPNGTAITADGTTLIVAESLHGRLTAFSVAEDGSLHDRRVYAPLTSPAGFAAPDGICLDAEGGVWWCDPVNAAISRTLEGGRETHRLTLPDGAIPIACVLGGADRRTLYVSAVKGFDHEAMTTDGNGRIDALTVEVPGAGRP